MRLLLILAILATLHLPAGAAEDKSQLQKQFDEKRQAIYDLQQQLISLLRRGEGDDQAVKQARELESRIAVYSDELTKLNKQLNAVDAPRAGEAEQAEQLRTALTQAEQHIAAMKQELEATRQMAQAERAQAQQQRSAFERSLPPIEQGDIKVFALQNAKAADAASTVISLFGPQAIRVAVDDRSNSLIVLGKSESLGALEALLMRIDQQAAPEGKKEGAAGGPGAPATQSLLLRIFWLADGLPEGEGQEPQDYLPKAVLKATERLGLHAPRLVTQTVNSLAVNGDREADFTTNVPAIVLKQAATLVCSGKMRPAVDSRAGLDVQIQVAGQSINCQLNGSLAIPLGHYMVLGTANSVVGDPAAMAGAGMYGGFGGEGGGFGAIPGRGGEMMGRGGYGGRAMPAAVDPVTGAPGADPNAAEAAEPKYSTSRFAFVVQVIEGESYAADQ